jgi:excisionase family DNA binding protein
MMREPRQRPAEQLLTVGEAAELLGTIERFPRRLIAERRIRFVHVGKHVRIPESALSEFSLPRASLSRSSGTEQAAWRDGKEAAFRQGATAAFGPVPGALSRPGWRRPSCWAGLSRRKRMLRSGSPARRLRSDPGGLGES